MTTDTIGLRPSVTPPDTTGQETVMGMVRAIIENEIARQPRSLQKRIGPSEIGNPCDHCLAARLAGWERVEQVAWLPLIGTAVHAWLEHVFTRVNEEETRLGRAPICYAEQTVTVGQIGGEDITGSTDLFLPDQLATASEGMTVDWKIVGNTTLNRVKTSRDPGVQYTAQAHLYAKGWENAGYPVSHVAVYFMPRNKMRLADGYVWIDEYQPAIADKALQRANHVHRQISALNTISKEATNNWITSLPRHEGCMDCKKYADWQTNLNDLLGNTDK